MTTVSVINSTNVAFKTTYPGTGVSGRAEFPSQKHRVSPDEHSKAWERLQDAAGLNQGLTPWLHKPRSFGGHQSLTWQPMSGAGRVLLGTLSISFWSRAADVNSQGSLFLTEMSLVVSTVAREAGGNRGVAAAGWQ